MSLKRAYCKKCKTKNDSIRIFEVNSEATVCYCPHCMAESDPQDVINNYNNYIQKQIDEAFEQLFVKTEFQLAYQLFAHILEIDNDALEARFGRILSLIYLSKLRRARFLDAALLIKEEASIYFRKSKNQVAYAKFIKRANTAVDEYYSTFKKKLSVKTYYYDDECIKLMYKRTQEVLDFKSFLLGEVNFINSKHENEDNMVIIRDLESQIDMVKMDMAAKAMAVDGYTYGLAGFGNDGVALLGHNTQPERVKLKFFRRKSLGNSDKKVALIKDGVYPDNTKVWHFIRNSIPCEIVFGTLTLLSIGAFFLFSNKTIKLISLIACGLFFVAGLTLLIVQLVYRHHLKKRGHLIN